MNTLLISTVVILIITWFIQGFNLVSILATIGTALFCARKAGHFCRFNTLVVLECVGIFLVTVTQMLFKNFVLSKLLVTIVLRCIFLCICLYDMKVYVYVKEVHRKGETE